MITLFVGTCDQYSVLWPNFTKCLEISGLDSLPTLMVGETIKHPSIPTATFNEPLPWGTRMSRALQGVDTQFVFFILEDYWMYMPHDNRWLVDRAEDMNRYRMNRLQLSISGGQKYESHDPSNKKYMKFSLNSQYKFSLQPALWRVDWLRHYLEGKNPWEFEVDNSTAHLGKETHTYIDPSINYPTYFNAVRAGWKKSKGLDQFIQQWGLDPVEGLK